MEKGCSWVLGAEVTTAWQAAPADGLTGSDGYLSQRKLLARVVRARLPHSGLEKWKK